MSLFRPVASLLIMDMINTLREHVAGKTALFVTNRADPELHRTLERELGLSITWCEGQPRRIDAQCDSIARGRYDLVLCATGFQSHATERLLCPAARRAGVPYVRVNKGRLAACVQALARDFGLAAA